MPAEVVVPLAVWATSWPRSRRKIDQPLVKEGVIIRNGANGEPEVVILGFIPSDQRKFSYNFVFGLSLTVIKIAEKHGGRRLLHRPLLRRQGRRGPGRGQRCAACKAFKTAGRPHGHPQPGKVLGNGSLGTAAGPGRALRAADPALRQPRDHRRSASGPTKPVEDIPADVAWYAYGCSQCGYCVDECDQFYGRGWESQSPRGKWYWLREYMEGREKWDQDDGRHLPGLHHLRAVQPALLGLAAHRAVLDEAARAS